MPTAERLIVHILSDGIFWVVQIENKVWVSGSFKNKKDAITVGRRLAKSAGLGQLKIHKRDGRFEKEFTYGKDPRRTKG